jgi:hypothetical protein
MAAARVTTQNCQSFHGNVWLTELENEKSAREGVTGYGHPVMEQLGMARERLITSQHYAAG